jgi:hypothetical protein
MSKPAAIVPTNARRQSLALFFMTRSLSPMILPVLFGLEDNDLPLGRIMSQVADPEYSGQHIQ